MIQLKNQKDQPYMTLEFRENVTRDDVQKLEHQLRECFAENAKHHQKNNVMIDLRQLKHATPGAIVEDIRLQAEVRDDLNKVALLGAPKSLKELAQAAEDFVGKRAQVKVFEANQAEDAQKWLAERS